MTPTMKKVHLSDRIRDLAKRGWTSRQIADEVGCLSAYVRVVLRQRVNGVASKYDIAYLIKKYGSLKAAAAAKYRANKPYHQAYSSKRWREDATYRAAHYARKARYAKEAAAMDSIPRKMRMLTTDKNDGPAE